MNSITINFPRKLVFGNNCLNNFIEEFTHLEYKRVLIVGDPHIPNIIDNIEKSFLSAGIEVRVDTSIKREPTIASFETVLKSAAAIDADSVIGIGGGSVLDVAKLVAALYKNTQSIKDVIGIGNLKKRDIFLACLPTTSGTGSEVSPNAILLDEDDNMKKGVISPFLMPDSTYVDPFLTITVPPSVTAATGIDALTHCIEAYANRFAHPIIDNYAINGIRLLTANIVKAVKNGKDIEARERISLGSMYGGICLGPVNTAAVHALSYPLGGEFHIAHGISNAVLLPYVMKFNAEKYPERYAEIALAIGAEKSDTDLETAINGIRIIENIYAEAVVPTSLRALNVPQNAIGNLAESALKVQRLLKNNLRDVTLEDAIMIYNQAY